MVVLLADRIKATNTALMRYKLRCAVLGDEWRSSIFEPSHGVDELHVLQSGTATLDPHPTPTFSLSNLSVTAPSPLLSFR